MTTIGFVRHGVTSWNKEGREQGSSDVPLDAEGIQMAKRIADRLAEEDWDVIYTSPLVRAKMTAELIAKKKPDIALIVDNRLREMGGGLVEGTTEEERIAKWGPAWKSLEMGFESNEEIMSRGLGLVEDIVEAYPGKRVLVVSHGSFINKLIKALVPTQRFDAALDNTSLTIIKLQGDGNFCSLYNCTKHL